MGASAAIAGRLTIDTCAAAFAAGALALCMPGFFGAAATLPSSNRPTSPEAGAFANGNAGGLKKELCHP